MHRLLILSISLALLGGCSCKGRPEAPASTKDAAPPSSQQAAPTPPALTPPPALSEPPLPERAMQLHAEGRKHGEAGRFEEALKSFQQAQEVAPNWLLPLYDTGFTYLLMKEEARALELYERLDTLAPQGFSDSKRMLDSLRREKAGRVPKGTVREFMEVQQLRDPVEIQRRLEALTRKAPAFVPAWHELAVSAEKPEEGERLLARALALEPDVETRGQLLLHQAVLLWRRGEQEAARKQLQALIDDARTTPGVVTEARELLNLPPSVKP